ncbi:hypothetical protein [Anaplasma bovis]|uniref:hypothetical protein n=1 Tax=Anaplasma bovis TaxID=186733 RepID=UPI002FF32D0E
MLLKGGGSDIVGHSGDINICVNKRINLHLNEFMECPGGHHFGMCTVDMTCVGGRGDVV